MFNIVKTSLTTDTKTVEQVDEFLLNLENLIGKI